MKCFIKNQLFYAIVSLLLFFNSCNGDKSSQSGKSSQRKNSHRETKEFRLCPEANLSEEQKAQIKELHKDSRSSTHERSREERHSAMAEIQKQILDTVSSLTEEQKSALAECFENRRDRRNREGR